MPRPPRAFVEGIYHLASHGSDTRDLFLSPEDRTTFLERLALVIERFSLPLVAYALLGNHYHLVLASPGGRVSSALQQLHGWYSRRQNRRHGRSAHLFRTHFFARELASDADLLVACRYLAHNPVAAGLSTDPFSWPWSSTAASVGSPRSRSRSTPARCEQRSATTTTGAAATWSSSMPAKANGNEHDPRYTGTVSSAVKAAVTSPVTVASC